MNSEDLLTHVFSRERILTAKHPPVRRANAMLFHIENYTSHLAAQSKLATQKFRIEPEHTTRNLAMIDAYTLGRTAMLPPSMREIERFAPQWGPLVPDNAALRAALAHQLGEKYHFSAKRVPQLRTALALDTASVQEAYSAYYQVPLTTIYAEHIPWREQVKWQWNRLATWLENLPPFWAVFALTLTEVVGASILALPIALAGIGPLPSLLLLLVFGLMNVLTVAYMAETATRSSSIRYGGAFLSQVVDDYLGRAGSLVLSFGLFVLITLALLAFYIGFAGTLAAPTHIPAPIWVALLFGVGLYYVTRGSLHATITSSLVIGAINLTLIVLLMLLTAPHITAANLTYLGVPFIGGRPFDPTILELIFGVILAAYFGHLSVPNSAHSLLRREPSGRALIHGAMAAQAVAILLNSAWIFVVNGTVPHTVMAGETGTALVPLARVIGPSVYLFGTIFIVLGMGMITIHFALGLFNLTGEWLPQRRRPPMTLLRRQGRINFYPAHRPAALPQTNLVYLGLLDELPHFRLDIQSVQRTYHIEIAVRERWRGVDVSDAQRVVMREAGLNTLELTVLEATARQTRVSLSTPLAIRYVPGRDTVGLAMSELLTLPAAEGELLAWMVHEEQVDVTTVAEKLAQPPQMAEQMLQDLRDRGFVREVDLNGAHHYAPRLMLTSSHRLSATSAKALIEQPGAPAVDSRHRRGQSWQTYREQLQEMLSSTRVRTGLGLLPMILVFVVAEAALMSGSQSFSAPLSFIGVVVIALLGGIYPVLLVAAGRQKGEVVPGLIYQLIGHRVLLTAIYLISLFGILLHGLVIWQNPLQRVLALVVVGVILAITWSSWRSGAFAPRVVIGILRKTRETSQNGESDDEEATNFTAVGHQRDKDSEGQESLQLQLTVAGRPYVTEAVLTYRDQRGVELRHPLSTSELPNPVALRQATLQLPAGIGREIKFWSYLLAPGDAPTPFPLRAFIGTTTEKVEIDLGVTGGQAILPLKENATTVTLLFS